MAKSRRWVEQLASIARELANRLGFRRPTALPAPVPVPVPVPVRR